MSQLELRGLEDGLFRECELPGVGVREPVPVTLAGRGSRRSWQTSRDVIVLTMPDEPGGAAGCWPSPAPLGPSRTVLTRTDCVGVLCLGLCVSDYGSSGGI